MTILITKANHDTWHKYKEFNTIEELYNYVNHCHRPLIFKHNGFFQIIDTTEEKEKRFGLLPKELAEMWGATIEDAYKINETKWKIETYNNYRK